MSSAGRTVFVFNSYGLGSTADGDLKLRLAHKFLQLIAQDDSLPAQLCFYTDGVRLCVHGSPVLEDLRALEAKGVELVLCSTCLEALSLTGQVAVGIVGGMPDIITAMARAAKVITV